MKYFFLSNDGPQSHAELKVEPFNAVIEQNDYEVSQGIRSTHISSHSFVVMLDTVVAA